MMFACLGRALCGLLSIAALAALPQAALAASLDPHGMPAVGTVDARYQSYNVEMAEIVGATFWKPYDRLKSNVDANRDALLEKRPPIDLSNARLRKLAAALGPAYMRVSGTWANTVYFQDTGDPNPEPAPSGFKSTLTRLEWVGVMSFARAVDAKVVTSFAISSGVRNPEGVWTDTQAKRLLAYTRSIGGEIAAAELFNEPTLPVLGGAPPRYDATRFGQDIAAFKEFAGKTAPQVLVIGPGSTGEGGAKSPTMLASEDLLRASPAGAFDVFSYHYYGSLSQRCAAFVPASALETETTALSEAQLARTDHVFDYYKSLQSKYAPGKPIWLTETADAACGGNPWDSTFFDSFRYLDQLARLAKRGVKVVFHNTLAASDYGLLDATTFAPRPDYWAALLWRRLTGTTVLDAGQGPDGLHLYAQCLRDTPGGIVLLAINIGDVSRLSLPIGGLRFTLSAPALKATVVMLNGRPLVLGTGDAFPDMNGQPTKAGPVEFAPHSITFIALPTAANPNCR